LFWKGGQAMKCLETKQYIHSYLDSHLTERQQQALYQHLSVCPSCQKELNLARKMNGLLEEACSPVEPPANFVSMVMQEIPDQPKAVAAVQQQVQRKPNLLKRWLDTALDLENKMMLTASYAAVFAIIGMLFVYGNGQLQGLTPGSPGSKPELPQENIVGQDGINPEVKNETGKEQPTEEQQNAAGDSKPGGSAQIGSIDQNLAENNSDRLSEISDNIAIEPIFTVILSPIITEQKLSVTHPVIVNDNEKILYLAQKNTKEDRYTVWQTTFDGKDKKMVAAGQYGLPLIEGGGAWSPDRSKIAYVTTRNGYMEIWVDDLDGHGTNLTLDSTGKALEQMQNGNGLWAAHPTWSSQGEIAYLTNRSGNNDIMAIGMSGSNRVITKTPANEKSPAWSPDGEKIAYFRSMKDDDTNTNQIYVVDKDGANPQSVTSNINANSMVPVWSPDGKFLAVNVGQLGPRAQKYKGVWLVDLKKNSMMQLTNIGGGNLVSWSPDGSKIAFTDEKGILYVAFIKDDFTVGQICQITPEVDEGSEIQLEWLDDSREIIFDWTKPGGTKGIWKATLPDVNKRDRVSNFEIYD